MHRIVLITALAVTAIGCGSQTNYIPGTQVPRTDDNQTLINRIEDYRMAVERRDSAALLLMASKRYWEDSGTPGGSDDYGYQDLGEILTGRLQKVDSIRYSMKYMNIERKGPRAYVDVLIDASFSLTDARGQEIRTDMRDQNQFVLEWDGKQWMFLTGM